MLEKKRHAVDMGVDNVVALNEVMIKYSLLCSTVLSIPTFAKWSLNPICWHLVMVEVLTSIDSITPDVHSTLLIFVFGRGGWFYNTIIRALNVELKTPTVSN